MNCMVIFVIFDVLLMSTVLAKPDRKMRSTKYVLKMLSASETKIPDRKEKRTQAYISGRRLAGQSGFRVNSNQELISERAELQDKAPQITTRREIGVVHSDACLANSEELDPKTYFDTDDDFLPPSYRTTVCTGKPGRRGYPNCVYGVLDCVTIKEDISFTRKPRDKNCSMWYTEVIKDTPVGCQCMWPQ